MQNTEVAVAARPEDVPEETPRSVAIAKRLCAWAPAFGAVALLAYASRAGMPALHAVSAALVVLVTQVLPGALAWRAVRPRKGWLVEDLVLGFALGSVFAIGAQVVAGLSGQSWLAYSPLLVAVVLMLLPVTRARIRSAETHALPWWWGPTVAGLFFLALPQLRGAFRLLPLGWEGGARAPYVDAYLHLALASQLAHQGPTAFPWVQSESLAYHWFSHAWVAQVSVASGAGLDEVLFRFMPAIMPVVVVLAVATAAVRLTGRYWTGPVAGLLALAGGDINVFNRISVGSPLAPLSPSLALAAPMVVGIVLVIALRWNKTMLSGGVLLLPVLALGAAGTKGSTVPLIVAGLGLTFVAMFIWDRTRMWPIVVDLAITTACLVFAVVFVFHGSEAGLHLSPTDAAGQTAARIWLGDLETPLEGVLVLAISVAGVLARGAALFVLPFSRSSRRNPLTWLLIGGALAGAGAVAVFAHPGRSQWYFARTAIPLLALGSAMGLVALIAAIEPAKRLRVIAVGVLAGPPLVWLGPFIVGPLVPGAWNRALAMIAIAAVVLAVAAVAGALGANTRTGRIRLAGATLVLTILSGGVVTTSSALLRPPPAPLPSIPLDRNLATSRAQIDAARWIRDHSDTDDLIMTNRHCTTPTEPYNCDTRRFVVAAFSERQVLLEGWTATPMSAKLGPEGRDSITVSYWHPELLSLNDGFIAQPTEEAARELRERGVRWIYVDHTRPYAPTLEPYATLRHQTADVDVYEFTGSD